MARPPEERLQRHILKRAKDRARRRSIPFALDAADIIVPRLCPILGIRLYRTLGQPAQRSHTPTLDRIDPRRGYTRGNVQVISSRANQIKSDASASELLKVACFVIQHGPQEVL